MPSKPLTARVSPDVHARLVNLATRRGKTLAATAADVLSAAVASEDGTPPPLDGVLVDAVRNALADVTTPKAVLCREIAVHMARIVESGEHGRVAAAEKLMDAVEKAIKAQRAADQPEGPSLDDFLTELGMGGLGGLSGF